MISEAAVVHHMSSLELHPLHGDRVWVIPLLKDRDIVIDHGLYNPSEGPCDP